METEGPGLFFTIAAFIGGFSLLVFIHEWGHYIVGRIFGVKIETFSIGMGKELIGRTDKRGTRWKFSAIPLGGYVKFYGDASAASNPGDIPEGMTDEEKAVCYHFKPLWQRALIVFAGPAVNLIAAWMVFSGLVYMNGMVVTDPVVVTVSENSAASEAGVQSRDRILEIDGTEVERFDDIARIIRLHPGQRLEMIVERDGQETVLYPVIGIEYFVDRFDNQYPYGLLGVSNYSEEGGTPYTRRIEDPGMFLSLHEGGRRLVGTTKSMFTTLGQMLLGVRSMKELGGIPRIANALGEAAHASVEYFVWMLAMLSLNLGIINLLPIPVLDGGHLLYYGLEAIKGSPISKKAQEAGFVAGFALMLIFMLLVTLNDLQSMAL
ncbi:MULTISPECIES: M50 family metallopeptidase [Kordiimonas]|jgi:regulator of sigma E protease|uniref:M50 family metallopeptidase n=1 Tax=Kordiimonas TaxID=288021 RepID=UPI00257C62AF|nr:M50 family metallopeptidase [Kordiimonas sp. UBA4487]